MKVYERELEKICINIMIFIKEVDLEYVIRRKILFFIVRIVSL